MLTTLPIVPKLIDSSRWKL